MPCEITPRGFHFAGSAQVNGLLNEASVFELRGADRRTDKSRRANDWGSADDRMKLAEWLFDATGPQLAVD